jgi:hypothetical protein
VEIAAFVVAVVAALISGGALLYTRRADHRAESNEKRLNDQEKRAQIQEERDKLREQREELVGHLAVTAYPRAEYIGVGASGPRAYKFCIRSTGQQAASDLDAQLIDAQGNPASERARISVLERDNSEEVEVVVGGHALDRNPLFLQLMWFDTGNNERISKVEVPPS